MLAESILPYGHAGYERTPLYERGDLLLEHGKEKIIGSQFFS